MMHHFFRPRQFVYQGDRSVLPDPYATLGWTTREEPDIIHLLDRPGTNENDIQAMISWGPVNTGLASGQWREITLEEMLDKAAQQSRLFPHMVTVGGKPDLPASDLKEIDQMIAEQFMNGHVHPYSCNYFFAYLVEQCFAPTKSSSGPGYYRSEFGGQVTEASCYPLAICLNALKVNGVDISRWIAGLPRTGAGR